MSSTMDPPEITEPSVVKDENDGRNTLFRLGSAYQAVFHASCMVTGMTVLSTSREERRLFDLDNDQVVPFVALAALALAFNVMAFATRIKKTSEVRRFTRFPF